MNKFKVFMANGTIQTIIADNYNIDWGNGRLRFENKTGQPVAIFPPGGWQGVMDLSIIAKDKAVV